MFKRTKLATCLLVAFGGGIGFSASPVLAQSATSAGTERIEVTGSRLRSLEGESSSPVQVVTGEEIAKAGIVNVQELLTKNPTVGTPGYSRTNSNFATASAGVATVDLRNLGSDRTLVLVNGRRFVAGVPGSSSVDLNTIPTEFIERVEILTGGASATYGSDAVAGVVNIILKKNFQGLSVNAQHGVSEKGDDRKDVFSMTMGANSENGRGNIMAHIGFSDQGPVMARDHGMPFDNISDGYLSGDPADVFKFSGPFYSGYGSSGRFYGDNGSYTVDANGNVVPWSTNGPAGDGVGAYGYNRQNDRCLAIPTKRFVFATQGEYAIDDNHSAWLEANYAQTQTKSRIEPFPLGSEDLFPSTAGQVPAEFLVNGQVVVNPLIPAGILADLVDTDGDGLRDYYFTRRLSDVGNRGNKADRDTFRIATGLRGSIFDGWDYDTYVSYGATKESQISSGQVNVLNFAQALQAMTDVDDVDGDGNTTEAVCISADARAQGCVPANIFGAGNISADALKYILAPGMLSTFTSQKLAGGVIRGEPFALPAGKVGVAAGFEWREEYARTEFDALQQAGLNAGNAIPRTEGSFSVRELFAETRIPLVKDQILAKSLSLNAAIRSSDYSTVGRTFSWTTGLEWAPTRDLRVCATKALAVRAPNINELYSPLSQTYPSVQDPCVGVTATSTGARDDACRADPGVAANIAANGSFTLNQSDAQGVSGYDSGNPNLKEETGKTWTLGLVYAPSALKSVIFTADYFRVKIEDAITNVDRQTSLNQCYGGDTSFCQFIVRRPANIGANSAGSLEFVNAPATNSGGLFTSGVDLTVSYSDRVGPGRLSGRLAYTYLDDGYVLPVASLGVKDPFVGEIGAARDRAALSLGYTYKDFAINTTTTYIGKSYLDDQLFGRGVVSVPSYTQFDFQASYTYGKATWYFGMDNAFNAKGAKTDSNALLWGTTGAGTAADVYDAIGRRYYAGVRFDL